MPLTLQKRADRLGAFLAANFPAFRIVISLRDFDDARRRGFAEIPEIRVIPKDIDGRSLLSWRVAVTTDDSNGSSETSAVSFAAWLRESLRSAPHPWRCAGGRRLANARGDDQWEEVLEEGYTPEGETPPRFLLRESALLGLGQETVTAGSQAFLLEELVAIPTGALIAAAGAEGDAIFLGTGSVDDAVISTEFPAVASIPPPVAFYTLAPGYMFPESVSEETEFQLSDHSEWVADLAGSESVYTFADPQRRSLRLTAPVISASESEALRAFLTANPLAIYTDSRQRLFSVSIDSWEAERYGLNSPESITVALRAAPWNP